MYPDGGGAVSGKIESPVVGAIWVIVRGPADPRRSYLSYLSLAKERMKVICLETWKSVILIVLFFQKQT